MSNICIVIGDYPIDNKSRKMNRFKSKHSFLMCKVSWTENRRLQEATTAASGDCSSHVHSCRWSSASAAEGVCELVPLALKTLTTMSSRITNSGSLCTAITGESRDDGQEEATRQVWMRPRRPSSEVVVDFLGL